MFTTYIRPGRGVGAGLTGTSLYITNDPGIPEDLIMKLSRMVIPVVLLAYSAAWSLPLQAMEFKVDCSSLDDCMMMGDKLTKTRKLSLALEAYRNAIKFDVENTDAWRKFEKIVVRIYEEGGC